MQQAQKSNFPGNAKDKKRMLDLAQADLNRMQFIYKMKTGKLNNGGHVNSKDRGEHKTV